MSDAPSWIDEMQAEHTARMSATGPLESIDDAIARMPRYTSEAVQAADEIDEIVKALAPSRLPFKIVWRWQLKHLREKTYRMLSRAVVIGTAWRLIAHHRRLDNEQ